MEDDPLVVMFLLFRNFMHYPALEAVISNPAGVRNPWCDGGLSRLAGRKCSSFRDSPAPALFRGFRMTIYEQFSIDQNFDAIVLAVIMMTRCTMDERQTLIQIIAGLEARLADLQRRMPVHSIPPAMIAEWDELDEQLAAARARLAMVNIETQNTDNPGCSK
jgi:hypothetical protein